MDELVSLRTCARLLGLIPMTLSRYIRAYSIPVLVIGSTYAMRPNEIRAALERAGKLPVKRRKRPARKQVDVRLSA